MSKLEIPDFPSEAEEAKWWFDNQDALDDEFLAAAAEGRLGVGTAAKLAGLPERSVELSWDDFELAKREAEKRGIKYQDIRKRPSSHSAHHGSKCLIVIAGL